MLAMRIIITRLIFLLLMADSFGQTSTGKLKISHLTGDFYVYTTYKILDGSLFPSNSMYMVTDKGVVLFDTPWDTTQFQPLLDSISLKHHQKVVLCISTHFHADRTAGLEYFRQKNIKTYSSHLTYILCKEHNDNQAEYYFDKDTTFVVGSHKFQTYFPGEGHTKDNIVIWFENEKILYGGCFVKSTENEDVGNIADANMSAWETSIKNLIRKYPKIKFIIPGHFGWNGNKALEHTIKILEEEKKKNTR
jgi:metallo-beta-lactamase class B